MWARNDIVTPHEDPKKNQILLIRNIIYLFRDAKKTKTKRSPIGISSLNLGKGESKVGEKVGLFFFLFLDLG